MSLQLNGIVECKTYIGKNAADESASSYGRFVLKRECQNCGKKFQPRSRIERVCRSCHGSGDFENFASLLANSGGGLQP